MAREGLRKVCAVALAIAGLSGAAVASGVGADAAEQDEFAIPESEYAITSDGEPSAVPPPGPDFAFIDANNNGTFESGVDSKYEFAAAASARGRKPKPVVDVDLTTQGFVIPSRVKKLDAARVDIESQTGRIEIGAGVMIKSEEQIYLIGGNVVVGSRVKLLSQGPVDLDTPDGGVVSIGDNAKVRAEGGIEDNAPDELNIGAHVALMAPDSGIELLDPELKLRIGDGTKFVANNIEFGLGESGTTFAIGDKVSFIAAEKVDIDNFSDKPLVIPEGTSFKAPTVEILSDNDLTFAAKLKSQSFWLRSSHAVRLDNSIVTLVAPGLLRVSGPSEGQRTAAFTMNGAKVNVGKGGTVKIWTNALPVDTSKIKPAEKTVLINDESTVTVNMSGTVAGQSVALEMYDSNLWQLPFDQRWVAVTQCNASTQNPCVSSFAKSALVRVKPAGGRPYVIGGECSATTGVVQQLQVNRTCTVAFQ